MPLNYFQDQDEYARIMQALGQMAPNFSRPAPSFADLPDFTMGVPEYYRAQAERQRLAEAKPSNGSPPGDLLMDTFAQEGEAQDAGTKAGIAAGQEQPKPPPLQTAPVQQVPQTKLSAETLERMQAGQAEARARQSKTRETPPIETSDDYSGGQLYPSTWDEKSLTDTFDAQGNRVPGTAEIIALTVGEQGKAVVLPVLPGETVTQVQKQFWDQVNRGEHPGHLGVYDSLAAAQKAAERLSYQLHPASAGMSQARPGEPLAELSGTPAGPPPPPAAPPSTSPGPAAAAPKPPSEREQLQSRIDQYVGTMLDRPENDPSQTMARVSTEGGRRPNVYGYEDEAGYDMDQRAARARELYRREQPSTYWTDEFLRTHTPPPDMGQIKRRTLGMTFGGGYDRAERLGERLMRERQAYEQGLMQARQMDLLQSQVAPETAQALAQMGLSPEAAVRARRGGPEVSAYKSGGYASGPTLTGQQRVYDAKVLEELGKANELRSKEEASLIEKEIGRTTAVEQAQAQKRGGVDEQLGQRIVANHLGETFKKQGWDFNRALSWIQTGDQSFLPEGVSPEQAQSALIQAQTNLMSTAGRQALAPQPAQRAADIKTKHAVRSSYQFRNHMLQVSEAFDSAKNAWDAWQKLSPEAKKAVVQVGRSAPDAAKSFVASTGGQPWEGQTGAIAHFINSINKENAGLAQTDHELQNIARETGATADWFDPFKSGEGLEAAMKRRMEIMKNRINYFSDYFEED